MPAAQTYEPIANATLGSATNSVTFSSISQAYTDLILVCTGTNSTGFDGIDIRVGNGSSVDTGSNYGMVAVNGNGTNAQSFKDINNTSMTNMGITGSSRRQVSIWHFMDYSNTSTFKAVVGRSNVTDFRVAGIGAIWRSTSAINRIQLRSDNASYNFTTGSTFTLWGIKAA
jgi:hypothetical protein